MPDTEIVHFEEGSGGLSLYRKPEQAIADAKACAVALKNVMLAKKNPVFFPDGNGGKEQYLEAEDWGLIAAFHGCTAKIAETEFVDYGPAGKGFKAVAVLVDRNGMELSRAESMTLDSEENWGMVTEYEWRDVIGDDGKKVWNQRLKEGKGGYVRERVKAGEKPKPLFQLLSMAQTRATAKVIGTKFRYIAVLAGYASTPAEEMTGKEFPPAAEPEPGPNIQKKSERQPETTTTQAETQPQTQTGGATGGGDPPKQTAAAAPGDPENGPEPSIRPRSAKGGTSGAQATQTAQAAPAAPQQQASQPQGELIISERQCKMMFAIQRSLGMSDEQMKQVIANVGHTGHRDQIPRSMFQAVLNAIDPACKFHTNN